jgi:hypothetical protein
MISAAEIVGKPRISSNRNRTFFISYPLNRVDFCSPENIASKAKTPNLSLSLSRQAADGKPLNPFAWQIPVFLSNS